MPATITPAPPALTIPSSDITVSVYEADNETLVGSLTSSIGRRAQATIEPTGSGELRVPYAAAADIALLTPGRMLRFAYKGEDVLSVPIKANTRRLVSKQGPKDEFLRIAGPGHLNEWARPGVGLHPAAGMYGAKMTKRSIGGWDDPGFDDSDWDDQTIVAESLFETKPPKAFPWPFTSSIWGPDSKRRLLARRSAITLTATKALWMGGSAADAFKVGLNGVPVGDTGLPAGTDELLTSFAGEITTRWVPAVTAGDHVITIEAIGGTSARWVAFLAFALDNVDTAELNTSTYLCQTGYLSGGVTLEPWKVLTLDLDDPLPSMTDGWILAQILSEFQDQGWLEDWTLDFDDELDSNGDPWEPQGALVVDIGRSGLEVLRQMAASRIDVHAPPHGKVLRATKWQGRGNFADGTLGPKYHAARWGVEEGRETTLLELEVTEPERGESGQMWIRTKKGLTSGTGRRPFVDLADLEEPAAADVADADAAEAQKPTTTVEVIPLNGDDEIKPSANWLGDSLRFPTGGPSTWERHRLYGVTVEDSRGPQAKLVLEANSLLAERQAIAEQKIERVRAGASGSAVISAPTDLGTGIRGGELSERRTNFTFSSLNGFIITGPSDKETGPSERRRLCRWEAKWTEEPSTDTVLHIYVNGVDMFPIGLTIPGGQDYAEGYLGDIYWGHGDELWLDITTAGTGGKGFNFVLLDTEAV